MPASPEILRAFAAHAARLPVYALVDEDEVLEAESPADGRPTVIFWRDRAQALACAKNGFEGFVPEEISPEELAEDWLPGIAEDGLLAGLDWDPKTLYGPEAEPEDLLALLPKPKES